MKSRDEFRSYYDTYIVPQTEELDKERIKQKNKILISFFLILIVNINAFVWSALIGPWVSLVCFTISFIIFFLLKFHTVFIHIFPAIICFAMLNGYKNLPMDIIESIESFSTQKTQVEVFDLIVLGLLTLFNLFFMMFFAYHSVKIDFDEVFKKQAMNIILGLSGSDFKYSLYRDNVPENLVDSSNILKDIFAKLRNVSTFGLYFQTEDYVYGKVESNFFTMCDLKIYFECNEKNVYIFEGLLLVSEIKNYSDVTMYIRKKATNKFVIALNSLFHSSINEINRYNTDISEFDKYYIVKCSNKEKAKQLLTYETIDVMLQYANENIEYAFLENKIYIFINKEKNQFESTIIRNPLSFEKMYEYYMSSQSGIDLLEGLLRSIK